MERALNETTRITTTPTRADKRRARRPPTKQTEAEQREQRLEKSRAERRQLRHRLVEDDDAVFTFKEWCRLNSIGERTGRRILASGNGPVVTQLTTKRIGITVRANREWQAQRARA